MFRQIFVNLPVKDMARSQAFFKALGLSFNPRFTNEQGACLEIGENFYAMLLVEPFFQGFTKKPIGDAHKTTEVILALYRRHGVDCLRFLRGMFAFAIWDERQKCLFFARDRLGKKPLHYAVSPQGFAFCSEIDPLARHAWTDRRLDMQALDFFLHLQYIPAPLSIYRGIRKLPPAHYGLLNASGLRIEPYWSPDYRGKVEMAEEYYYFCPAPIDEALDLEIKRLTAGTFYAVGCQDVCRVDFRLDANNNNKPYILEINPLPGLSPNYSDLCLQALAMGWEHEHLVGAIFEAAVKRCGLQE